MRLKAKVVLVTGASKGIGRAIALGVAHEGADVAVHYNSDPDGARTVAEAIAQLGRRAPLVQADLAQVSDIRRMFAEVEEQFERLDILVNNAAVMGWADLFSITEDLWDQVIDTNLRGAFFCAVEAARLMRRNEHGGSIVNVSTNCAELAVRNLAAYATSKGGLNAMTRQLAVELAPYQIRVNTFAPGPTRVERNLADDPDYDRTWSAVVPLGRTADPEEMVGPAIFLASDESSYMTGQVFYVDGGWTAQGRLPDGYFDAALGKH
jgi:glucose 1-dehydrogenase